MAPAGGFDEHYSYDGLDQVTDRKLGTLWGATVTGVPVEEEQFGYDARGNWPSYTINENGVSTLNQTRIGLQPSMSGTHVKCETLIQRLAVLLNER